LPTQRLALGEARHDAQRVAEDHAVRPVGLVAVELDEVELAKPIECLEQRQLGLLLRADGRVA